ncbi:MAG: hypothetical protein AAB486_02795 [Patescibacteria group bacterium]
MSEKTVGPAAGFVPSEQWAAVAAAHQNISKMSEGSLLVRIFNAARTYFTKNL